MDGHRFLEERKGAGQLMRFEDGVVSGKIRNELDACQYGRGNTRGRREKIVAHLENDSAEPSGITKTLRRVGLHVSVRFLSMIEIETTRIGRLHQDHMHSKGLELEA
jgi:hypothetical protein